MGEVRYSVNGNYFRDWNVYVSDSEGLFDALKRKKVNSYQWAEYHGQSVDLSSPKYEAREITLKCFVVGDNWVAMKANFDALVSEFQKSGTQRLLIEPFGLKPLPYEVYMEDSSELQKTFKEGKMVGVFSLKLIEPNPIKKVLYLTGSSLNLAYNSPKETEIFYGNGLKETASGNVSLSGKTLANRVLSGYGHGRNLILNSKSFIVPFSSNAVSNFNTLFIGLEPNTTYTLSWSKAIAKQGTFDIFQVIIYKGNADPTSPFTIAKDIQNSPDSFTFTTPDNGTNYDILVYSGVFGITGSKELELQNVKLEKGASATPYSIAPEEEKFIIIAGNVDEITGLTTNAEVLWEKL